MKPTTPDHSENSQDPEDNLQDFQPVVSLNYEHKKRDQLIIIFDLWLTLILMIITNRWLYYNFLFGGSVWRYLLIPLFLYGLSWQFLIYSTIFSTIIYKILCFIEPPKQGTFDLDGREFKYYCLRFWVAYYLLYIARAMPIPWVDMYLFPIFGSKAGKNVVLYDSWIDPEFVHIGDSCMISLNTQIYSSVIIEDKFIVQEVYVAKNCIAGGGAIIAPGTILEEGAILGAKSRTKIGQHLGGYLIHIGNPVSKYFPITVVSKELVDKRKEIIENQNNANIQKDSKRKEDNTNE